MTPATRLQQIDAIIISR